jgi:hypothetical protein
MEKDEDINAYEKTEPQETIEAQENVEAQEIIEAHEKRRQQVYVDNGDVLARVLGVRQGDYECVKVNHSWPEKGLIEGDIILFVASDAAEAGDIILIEEEGQTRLGIIFEPGFLETRSGSRPLEAQERIIGVGVALARKLGGSDFNYQF